MANKTYTFSFDSLGADLDNFALSSDAGPVTPNAATRSQLLAGLTISVSDLASVIVLTPSGMCRNTKSIALPGAAPIGRTGCYKIDIIKADYEGSFMLGVKVREDGATVYTIRSVSSFVAVDHGHYFTINVCSQDEPVFVENTTEIAKPSWITLTTVGTGCTNHGDCS